MPLSNEPELIISAIKREITYLSQSRRRLSAHHEAALAFAIAAEYRARQASVGLESAFALVEGYYSDTRTPLTPRSAGEPRADVYGWWPNNERFIEIKWGWGRTERRSWLEYYLWPALSDLGKLLTLVQSDDGTPPAGKRVFTLVAASDDSSERIRDALGRQYRGLPDRETLERQLANVYKGTRHRLLPGDVDPGEFDDLWRAFGYLQSVVRSLANNAGQRCAVEILEDAAPIPQRDRHRYAVLACRF